MKNKLFYGLFFVYAVVFAFILYINGVFSGNTDSMSNLLINVGFLVLIGVMFVGSAISFLRLNHMTDELVEVAEEIQTEYKKNGSKNIWHIVQESKGLFGDDNLKIAYAKYRARLKSLRTGKKYSANVDIEDFINEELVETVGKHFYNSAIPGTMTGLGILGTFIGLSLGLGSFNGDDIYTISDNVGPLLTGMKVAFHTSVYGIIFSLIFDYVYRSIMSDAYDKLDYFLNTFKQCALPPTTGSGEENMAAMLVYQANMAAYLKQMLDMAKGESEEQSQAVGHMVEQFANQMQNALGVEFGQLGDALLTAAAAQKSGADASARMVEATRDLVESNRSMMESLKQLQKQQEAFAAELALQKQTLEMTCEDISRDVSNQLYTFEQMRNYYEK